MKLFSPWKIVIASLVLMTSSMSWGAVKAPPAEMSEETKECVTCHKKNNPSVMLGY